MADLVSTQGWPLTAASTHQVALQGWATGMAIVLPLPVRILRLHHEARVLRLDHEARTLRAHHEARVLRITVGKEAE
jgi:hypothetical protein